MTKPDGKLYVRVYDCEGKLLDSMPRFSKNPNKSGFVISEEDSNLADRVVVTTPDGNDYTIPIVRSSPDCHVGIIHLTDGQGGSIPNASAS